MVKCSHVTAIPHIQEHVSSLPSGMQTHYPRRSTLLVNMLQCYVCDSAWTNKLVVVEAEKKIKLVSLFIIIIFSPSREYNQLANL